MLAPYLFFEYFLTYLKFIERLDFKYILTRNIIVITLKITLSFIDFFFQALKSFRKDTAKRFKFFTFRIPILLYFL